MVVIAMLNDYASSFLEQERDAAAEACLDKLLAYLKERRDDPRMKFLLLNTIKILCPEPSVNADALAFFKDKGILDP